MVVVEEWDEVTLYYYPPPSPMSHFSMGKGHTQERATQCEVPPAMFGGFDLGARTPLSGNPTTHNR